MYVEASFLILFHFQDAVRIIEKEGKAWHILDEGRSSSLAQTVSGDFDMYNGMAREFLKFYKQTNPSELRAQGIS